MTTTDSISSATRAKLFRSFADASRLAIVETLRRGARNVGEIVDETGLSQSNVSNHLACLLDCGLVAREPEGRFAYYTLSDPGVAELLRVADDLLLEVAGSVEACPRPAASEEA